LIDKILTTPVLYDSSEQGYSKRTARVTRCKKLGHSLSELFRNVPNILRGGGTEKELDGKGKLVGIWQR